MRRILKLRFVIFVVLFAVILGVGLAAGIFAGNAVAGSTSAVSPPSQETSLLGSLGSSSPLRTQLQTQEKTSTDSSLGQSGPIAGVVSNQDSLTSTSGTTVSVVSGQTSQGPERKPDDIGGAFFGPNPRQASLVFSSGAEVRVGLLGDVDLSGVVDIEDLTHILRALGNSSNDNSRPSADEPILVLDWNGDGFVDIEDLAIVAFHQGEEL